jgi:Tc toxin complex TcA C-terminal TcB-binding domain
MGYPGHYMRRIKTVALTFACIVGPSASVNCVLRLLEHKFRTDPTATNKSDYPERTDGTEDRFNTVNVPISSIAVSTGQNDSGVFELNFRDERYIPFEGAGAISKWRIELPKTFREFDYDLITDVVMHHRYTALDAGHKLGAVAAGSVDDYVAGKVDLSQDEGLFALFDLRHDFPNEWYKATQPPTGATERVMNLGDVYERLPFFTKGTTPEKIVATQAYLFSSTPTLTLPTISLNDIPLSPNPTDVDFPMKDWQLKIGDVTTQLDQLWLVVRYTLS